MKKYKVDFINSGYRRYWDKYGQDTLKAIDDCGKRGDYVMRQDLLEFEKQLARYVGTKYAVGVNSGTDALFLSLKALKIGGNYFYLYEKLRDGKITREQFDEQFDGDEVITVSHTFIASLQVIAQAGARPVLIDIGEDGLIDVKLIEAAITKRTKAIMPIHLSGKVCDMTAINRIAKKYKLYVIEDSCQAQGATWHGKKAGSFGITGCFSFISPKLMGGFGDNGAVTTNNKEIYERLLLLRNHWNITQGALHGVQPKAPKAMEWGWNSRMDNIQAAALSVKLRTYPWILKRREEIAMRYSEGLRSLPFKLPVIKSGQVFQEFIIRVLDLKKFRSFMEKHGIELLIRDTTPNYKLAGLYLNHFHLPVTDELAKSSVRLPTYPELRNEEVDLVIRTIRNFYGK